MKYQVTSTAKARRCTVQLGDIALTVFQLPDGSYRLSQTEIAGIIHKPARSIFVFLRSKQLKDLLDKGFQFSPPVTNLAVEGSPKPITPIPIEMALLYWHKWAQRGNTFALALVLALAKRSIYEAADEALGVKRSKSNIERTLAEDVSDAGVARIDAMYQALEPEVYSVQTETQTERELKLKIRLAELELEREKLQHSSCSNSFPATDISRVGVPPWQVIPWTQKTMGWSSWTSAARLLYELGFGYKTQHWFKLRIEGELWVMPQDSFSSLQLAVERFKADQN